jgi:hypothetical protein
MSGMDGVRLTHERWDPIGHYDHKEQQSIVSSGICTGYRAKRIRFLVRLGSVWDCEVRGRREQLSRTVGYPELSVPGEGYKAPCGVR